MKTAIDFKGSARLLRSVEIGHEPFLTGRSPRCSTISASSPRTGNSAAPSKICSASVSLKKPRTRVAYGGSAMHSDVVLSWVEPRITARAPAQPGVAATNRSEDRAPSYTPPAHQHVVS